jgi:hypothetical protein
MIPANIQKTSGVFLVSLWEEMAMNFVRSFKNNTNSARWGNRCWPAGPKLQLWTCKMDIKRRWNWNPQLN